MAGLKTYHAKRRFGVTAEPKGTVGRKRGKAFVIQKHDATRLHYDLRLEVDGVMKSWAVTRGPSLVPGEKRLAVEVEDHPIAYNAFEGTIPAGEYGGGTVMIWDRGTWTPEIDPRKGLAKGHLAFTLDGEKLHGGWHLVRMHRKPNEKRNNWLLIKQHDDAERTPRGKDILDEMPLSVTTGRSLAEIAKGAPKRKSAAKRVKKSTTTRTKKGNTASATSQRKTKRKTKLKTKPVRAASLKPVRKASAPLLDAPRGALPAFIAPALATLAATAPTGDAWLHEIKFDGYRLQARLDHGKVKLFTRSGLDWTAKFAPLAQAIARLPADAAVIDGEAVVEGNDGVSSFSKLQQALKAEGPGEIVFYAFDLLHLDGRDLRALPLRARKEALEAVLSKSDRKGLVRFSASIDADGPALLKRACGLGLEGIISKRADAPYRSGRGHDWLKIKCSDRQELIVAGFVPSTADAHAIGALVVAVNDEGALRYVGRVGTGFTHQVARDLYKTLKRLAVKRTPFASVPDEERGRRAPVWVTPKVVIEADLRGWTDGGAVRHASFQGVREDKPPAEVVREVKAMASRQKKPSTTSRKARNSARSKREPKTADTIGAIALTHPERIYWKEGDITKHDLADYYVKVWKWIAPHLVDRPLSLLRCPEGAAGQCFFQKHASAGIATDHLTLVPEDGDKIITLDSLDGVISLAQAGVLELHTRGSTADHLDKADRLVFDLDPGPGVGWKDVVAAARDVRDRLARLKLKTFIKTSGGKGLHVVLPITPTPWEEAKAFTEGVARAMEADEPERYVSTATKAKRGGRIFIDYLRNSREATAIAPYSTRARPGAPVSVPIDWSELGKLKSADQYTVKNVMQRLSRRKDPWSGIARVKQRLPKIK